MDVPIIVLRGLHVLVVIRAPILNANKRNIQNPGGECLQRFTSRDGNIINIAS